MGKTRDGEKVIEKLRELYGMVLDKKLPLIREKIQRIYERNY